MKTDLFSNKLEFNSRDIINQLIIFRYGKNI